MAKSSTGRGGTSIATKFQPGPQNFKPTPARRDIRKSTPYGTKTKAIGPKPVKIRAEQEDK